MRLFRERILTNLEFLSHIIGLTPIMTEAHQEVLLPFIDDYGKCEDHQLLLAFREMGKTSFMRAKLIQVMLNNPNARILYASDTIKFSSKQVRAIRNVLGKNKILLECFPDILWTDPFRQKLKKEFGIKDRNFPDVWSTTEIVLKRTIGVPEATLTAGALNPMPTGGHYTHIVFDDLMNPENSEKVVSVKQVKERFNYFYSIISKRDGEVGLEGPMMVVGTPYDYDDLYAVLAKDKGYRKLKIPCFLTPELAEALGREYTGPEKDPTCPEIFPKKLLDRKKGRLLSHQWNNQYLLKIHDDTKTIYRAEWLRKTYDVLPDNVVFATIVDPAGDTETETGESTVLTVAIDEWSRVYFCEGNRSNFTPLELAEVVLLHRKLTRATHRIPSQIGVEKAALQAAFKSVFQQHSDEAFVICDLRHGNKNWFLRGYAMAVKAQNEGFFFPSPTIYPEKQWWVDEIKDQLLRATPKREKGAVDWWDCVSYVDQMITKHHVIAPRTGDRAYAGDDGMEVEDEIIGY